MKKVVLLFITSCFLAMIVGCSSEVIKKSTSAVGKENRITLKDTNKLEQVELTSFNKPATEWGEHVTGVKTRINTDKKVIALTFDACGGDHGSDYDEELVSFLKKENIPATLFINEQWIHANEGIFLELAENPLFQIENHGTHHLPLSVDGGEAWGIQATQSPQDVYDEIMKNHKTVQSLTGKEMNLFRSGTAFYDEVAVELAHALGYEVVNFDILGDAGATYSSEQVTNALLTAKQGSIALMHMNQPESGTAEGVKQAIPHLREKGFEFILLEEQPFE